MGPYCKFCNTRCFVPLTASTPEHIQKAYGNNSIAATCKQGQAFEKEKIGYCYQDILDAAADPNPHIYLTISNCLDLAETQRLTRQPNRFTILLACNSGNIPFYNPGHIVLIRKSDYLKWLTGFPYRPGRKAKDPLN